MGDRDRWGRREPGREGEEPEALWEECRDKWKATNAIFAISELLIRYTELSMVLGDDLEVGSGRADVKRDGIYMQL